MDDSSEEPHNISWTWCRWKWLDKHWCFLFTESYIFLRLDSNLGVFHYHLNKSRYICAICYSTWESRSTKFIVLLYDFMDEFVISYFKLTQSFRLWKSSTKLRNQFISRDQLRGCHLRFVAFENQFKGAFIPPWRLKKKLINVSNKLPDNHFLWPILLFSLLSQHRQTPKLIQ